MKVEHWILRHRGGTYALMCAGLLFGGAFGVALGNAPTGTATYACLLTMLCLMPALWMERVNDATRCWQSSWARTSCFSVE